VNEETLLDSILLLARLSTHIRYVLSFFGVKSAGIGHGLDKFFVK